MRQLLLAAVTCALVGCSDDVPGNLGPGDAGAPDTGVPVDAGLDAELVLGCQSFFDPVAAPGDDIGGDTYATWAGPSFFERHCTHCHASFRTTFVDRMGAPTAFDFDTEAAARVNLATVRFVVGVSNEMPPTLVRPTCEERLRLLRWIDVGAP